MRLLWSLDSPACADEQMRSDRQLLHRCKDQEGVRLRVYRFRPRAISLGHHQSLAEVDVSLAQARGVDLVHRPTGGAAVLHADEWTYAAAAAWGQGNLRRPRQAYDAMAAALRDTLRALGIAAELGGGGSPRGPACFEAAGGHEIVVAGRKLVGSALRTTRHGWLQHGSVLTGPGHLELVDFLDFDDDDRGAERARAEMAARTVTLGELGCAASRGEFGAELARQLGRRLALPVEPALASTAGA